MNSTLEILIKNLSEFWTDWNAEMTDKVFSYACFQNHLKKEMS